MNVDRRVSTADIGTCGAMRSRALVNKTEETEKPPPLYDRDFALWIEGQVAAIRSADVAGLDIAHLVEELEGLTKRDVRSLGSQLKRIMAHLLKLRYQP